MHECYGLDKFYMFNLIHIIFAVAFTCGKCVLSSHCCRSCRSTGNVVDKWSFLSVRPIFVSIIELSFNFHTLGSFNTVCLLGGTRQIAAHVQWVNQLSLLLEAWKNTTRRATICFWSWYFSVPTFPSNILYHFVSIFTSIQWWCLFWKWT